MELLLLGIHLLIGLFIVAMIALVLRNNINNPLNRSFAYFLTALLFWSLTNFASNLTTISYNASLLANHLVLAAGSLFLVFLLIFCVELLEFRKKNLLKTVTLITGGVSAILAMTPLVVVSVSAQKGAVAIEFGPLAAVYFLALTGLTIATLVLLGIALFHQKDGVKKQRAVVMLSSISMMVVLTMTTNVAVPLLTGQFILTTLGPLFSVVVFAGTGYAIIKHRLFDIRLIAARSLAYVFSIAFVVLAYTGIVYGLLESVFRLHASETTTKVIYIITALGFALSFQIVKRFFDRLTDGIFFRKEYNAQDVLNQLGNTIVDQIDLHKIVTESLDILYGALKFEFATIIIFSKDKSEDKKFYTFQVGKVPVHLDEKLHENMINTLKDSKERITVTLQIDQPGNLRQELHKGNIASVLRLETSRELVGYLFLGERQNGMPYNTNDIRMLRNVGSELGLAIQNSLRFFEIQSFNERLLREVEEATKQIRASNKKLQSLDEAKDEFISMASHQLRTPLTSVKGYVSMVLEGDAGELAPPQRKLLEEAYASSQRMVYLIGDFLNVSRIQTGKFMIEHGPVNLANIVADEVEQLKATAEAHELTIHYQEPKNFPVLQADENKLRQVIMNFIDNAIFYSKPDTEIEVQLMHTAGEAILKVKDKGIGVPSGERHHLFTKFFRASNARKARPDGTGIGLFMAKKVVVGHGGSVIFETTEGKGSTFGFRLPLRTVAPDAKKAPEPVQTAAMQ